MNETTKPHSKLGIASCVIALITFLIFLIAIGFWLNGFRCPVCSEDMKGYIMLVGIGVVLVVPIPTHLVGLILGIVSLFFPNRKKLFPIIGIVLNLIFGVIGMFPLLLGMALAA